MLLTSSAVISKRSGLSKTAVSLILLKSEAILCLFQTYIDVFKNIDQSNPVAVGISVVAILVLCLYNEVIKVSEIIHNC